MNQSSQYLLITGASSGLGRVLCINLSKKYNIILHGRDEVRLQQTLELCSNDRTHLIFKLDLTDLKAVEQSVAEFIVGNKIEIIGFVHCAGYMKMLPLKMMSLALIETTFATNVFAASLLIKALMVKKINNNSLRSIVFLSSNISNFGAKAFSVYAASKGAIDSFMRCLAVELAPLVRVNSVLPGAIKTEMTEQIFNNEEVKQRMEKEYPLGLGSPEDISDMVEFLLSEKAKWITGQQFVVDGGRTINISG